MVYHTPFIKIYIDYTKVWYLLKCFVQNWKKKKKL